MNDPTLLKVHLTQEEWDFVTNALWRIAIQAADAEPPTQSETTPEWNIADSICTQLDAQTTSTK